MQDKLSKSLTKMKKNKKVLNEDEESNIYNNGENGEYKTFMTEKSKKQEITKKLKHIFNDVREKGKFEYKKQELPEHLKYHTDSDSSEYSKQSKLTNIIKKTKNNNSLPDNNKSFLSKLNSNGKENSINNSEKIENKNKKLNTNKNKNNIEEQNNINKMSEKNKKNNNKKTEKNGNKPNNVRDIIEKLKLIKSEKEDLIRMEKEAEEQSIMREKNKKLKEEKEDTKEKISDSDIEREKEKILKNEKKIKERRLAREKRRKKEEEEKLKKEKEFKEKKLLELNNIISNSKKTKVKKGPQLTYKKPSKTSKFINKKNKVYCPKKPINPFKDKNIEQIDINSINNDNIDKNYELTTFYSRKSNGNNIYQSPNLTYSKKRSKDNIRNYLKLNKSFGDFKTQLENGNNIKNRFYNLNSYDMSSTRDLNSSFDSRAVNYNNSMFLSLNNNDQYWLAKKNYNINSLNSGLKNNISYDYFNNIFNRNNKTNYINGENDFNNINNFSLYDIPYISLNSFDLNSSYNIGYNNPLGNFGFNNMLLLKESSLNIADILILEEKFIDVFNTLNENKIVYNECFDFLNFYFNCSLCGVIEKLFNNILDSNNIQISINYILMSIIICYDCSFDIKVFNSVNTILKDILKLNHKNLVLIYEYILGKIEIENKDNIWVKKLLNIVNSDKNNDIIFNINKDENNENIINEYSMNLMDKINYHVGIIIQNIRVLLKNYKTPKVKYLTNLFKKLSEKSYNDIDIFYKENILNVNNINGSLFASTFIKKFPSVSFSPPPCPYIHTANPHEFSLVLDLNETLAHFKSTPDNNTEGILKVRPGVSEFLEELSEYYELIVFTGSNQEHANSLIDAIEEDNIFFEHRFYRQHMIIIGNEFVKDLRRIGRPIDKIIIVDNSPQNYRLQKENGICIKSFWGEDVYDMNLIYLKNILINIAKEGGDVRVGIKKYKNEIFEKIESNLYKNNI